MKESTPEFDKGEAVEDDVGSRGEVFVQKIEVAKVPSFSFNIHELTKALKSILNQDMKDKRVDKINTGVQITEDIGHLQVVNLFVILFYISDLYA